MLAAIALQSMIRAVMTPSVQLGQQETLLDRQLPDGADCLQRRGKRRTVPATSAARPERPPRNQRDIARRDDDALATA